MRAWLERLARDRVRVYKYVTVMTGLADGLWLGFYAWFVYHHLQFTPVEVSLLVGGQFILQILLELPSGTWAERENQRNLLVFAYLSFAALTTIYAGLAVAADALGPHLTQQRGWLLLAAFLAECCGGVGLALLSGTLDAWVEEHERALSEREPDEARYFKERLELISTFKQNYAVIFTALTGAFGFWVATLGWVIIPWVCALGGYLAILLLVRACVLVDRRREDGLLATLRNVQPVSRRSVETVARYAHRAFSYLTESRTTLPIYTRCAFAYVVFYAAQVFWVVYVAQTLGIGTETRLQGASWLDWVPLLAAIWLVGELARSLGAASFPKGGLLERLATLGAPRVGPPIALALTAYALGLLLQVSSVFPPLAGGEEVLIEGPRVAFGVFGLGFLISKLAEGRIRKQIDVVIDQSIYSERATQRSIDAFIRSLFGLFYLAAVGSLMQTDAVLGYLFLLGLTLLAGAIFLASGIREDALGRQSLPQDAGLSRPARQSADDASFRRVRRDVLAALALLLIPSLGGIALSVYVPPGVLSRWLTDHSLEVEHLGSRSIVLQGNGPSRRVEVHSWSLELVRSPAGTPAYARCRTRPLESAQGIRLDKAALAPRLEAGADGPVLELGLVTGRPVEIEAPTPRTDPFLCLKQPAEAPLAPGQLAGLAQPIPIVHHDWRPLEYEDYLVLIELLAAALALVLVIFLSYVHVRGLLRAVADVQASVRVLQTIPSELKPGLTGVLAPDDLEDYERRLDELADLLHASEVQFGSFRWLPGAGTFAQLWSLPALPRGDEDAAVDPSEPTLLTRDLMVRYLRRLIDDGRTRPVCSDQLPSGQRAAYTCVVEPLSPKVEAVAFAGSLYADDHASKYVDPAERDLLTLLAQAALTQHSNAAVQFQAHDLLHSVSGWLEDVVVRAQRIDEQLREDDDRGRLLGLLQTLRRHARKHRRRIRQLIRHGEDDLEELQLYEELYGECQDWCGSPTRMDGELEVRLHWRPESLGCTVPALFWGRLNKVLTELFHNAADHGPSEEEPDVGVDVRVHIAPDDQGVEHIAFEVESDGVDHSGRYRAEDRLRHYGLEGVRLTVLELGGSFAGVRDEEGRTRVTFRVPCPPQPPPENEGGAQELSP